MIGKTFGFATYALCVAQTQALEWSELTDMARAVDWIDLFSKTFNVDLNDTIFFEDGHLTTRHTVRAQTSANNRRVK